MRALNTAQGHQVSKWIDRLEKLPTNDREDRLRNLRAQCEVDRDVLSLVALHFQHPPEPDRCRTGESIGNFTLGAQLGSGGMGVVYRARQESLGRNVALKLIHPALVFAGQSDAVERFQRESRLLAQCTHAHIATIYEGGIHIDPPTQERIPFFAMQLVEGGVPLTVYAKDHALTMSERLKLFLRVCEAMQVLHRQTVIHWDLKPNNILVDQDGHPFVIDFGLARVCDPSRPRGVERVSGTPAYMSPEQVAGDPVAYTSDVYTLGIILYELLAERHPYAIPHNASWEAIRQAILTAVPVPLSRYNPECHADLECIVAKALKKPPADRYQWVTDLHREIATHLALVERVKLEQAVRLLPMDLPSRAKPSSPTVCEEDEEDAEQSARVITTLTPITWSELCNCCKNITEKSKLRRHQNLEKLYVQRKNVHDQFMQFLRDNKKRCFVLLGKTGTGKSSFLLSLAEEMKAKEGQSPDNQENTMLLYDGACLKDMPFNKAVDKDFSEELGRPVENIWQAIARIDGIDKHLLLLCVDTVGEKELIEQVDLLVSKDWPWLKVLLISRPQTWRMIRKGIPLAEVLYYRGEDVTTGGQFNYSVQMKPFSLEELPQAYAKYQREYQIRTEYKDLSRRIREIISDPFYLWLIAVKYRDIPSNLKVSELIKQYLTGLIEEDKLQEGDWQFLENYLVPLMAREDHTFYDEARSDWLTNTPLLRLCDADILISQAQGTVKFTHERFYEHFVGQRIANLSKDQPDRSAFFLELIEKITGSPFLWGAVRNALVELLEAKKPDAETILKLCHTAESQQVKEMMVDVLMTFGLDNPEKVEEIPRSLVPEAKKASEWQKIRQVVKKSAKESDIVSRNAGRIAGRIAIEVASTLGITWVLQRAALHEDQSLRTAAVLGSYYLWQHHRAAGFAVLDYIAEKATAGFTPNFSAFESVFGLSMLILCDHYQDEGVISRLQGIWRGMLATLLRVHESSSPWKRAMRDFTRERIIAFVITVVFGLVRQLPPSYSMLSYPSIEAFFKRGMREKALYRNLIRYLDVDGDYDREQMERDYLAVLHIDNVIVSFTTLMGLVAHACSAPSAFLPFLKQLFEEAKKDVSTYPYLTVIANVAMNVLHRDWMNDEMFDFFVQAVDILQDAYTRHPETYHSRMAEAPQAAALAPYILTQYRRAETVSTAWLKTRIDAALSEKSLKSEKKPKFFKFLLTSELPQVGIENQEPRAALETVKLFFKKCDTDMIKDTQAFLSRLRVYYPDEVEAFLAEQQASEEFCLQVRTHEPIETVGDLIGKRAWYFVRESILLGSPTLRYQLLSLFEKASECKNVQTWVDYIIRYLVNLIYGGQVLRQSK